MTAVPVTLAGRYRLGRSLGAGGMGRVWLARDEVLDRDVAIKEIVVPDELAADRATVQRRTLREARAAARLSHPNVARIYDVVEADGRTWIVMEYVPSRSLQEVIRQDGPLPPGRVARIGLELLAALDAAQRAGVLHRDVKPANVLLADDGRIMLTDFGVAAIEGDTAITSSDVVLGSPLYMPPERVRLGATGATSDLWSLGATLYAAVEGHSPYERASAMETLTALAVEEPEPARQAGVLQPVLDGLLRTDPKARIDTAEAQRRLRAAASAAPGPAPVPPRRRTWVRLVAAAVVLVLAGAVAIWLAVRPGPGTSAHRTAAPTTATTPAAPTPSAVASSAAATAAAPPTAASATSAGPPAGPTGDAGSRPALPQGWRDYHDKTGFSVYVPDGWNRSQDDSIVYFRDPATGRVLGIDQSDEPRWDPVADWTDQAAHRVRHGDFPGYHQIRIAEVPYWRKAADWEFTFDGKDGRQHVNNRGFVVSRSQAYGIYWQTSDSSWDAAKPDLQLVFDSFRPAQD